MQHGKRTGVAIDCVQDIRNSTVSALEWLGSCNAHASTPFEVMTSRIVCTAFSTYWSAESNTVA